MVEYLVICSLIGLVISFFYKGIFHKIIAFGLVIPILLAFVLWAILESIIDYEIFVVIDEVLVTIIFCSTMIMAILTMIYGFKELKHNKLKQISIICFGFWFFIEFIFKFMYLPFVNYFVIAIILSFIAYIISLIIDKKHFTKEISFMIIWLGYTLQLLQNLKNLFK